MTANPVHAAAAEGVAAHGHPLPHLIACSGTRVDLLDPRPEQISIRDIAHHLALINRFNGATVAGPYSVAQHSCVVAGYLADYGPVAMLLGLLHDAHEAYLCDLITPVRRAIVPQLYHVLCSRFDGVIRQSLRLTGPSPGIAMAVDHADRIALATEWRDLMPGDPPSGYPSPHGKAIKPLPWHRAEEAFLKMYEQLSAASPRLNIQGDPR